MKTTHRLVRVLAIALLCMVLVAGCSLTGSGPDDGSTDQPADGAGQEDPAGENGDTDGDGADDPDESDGSGDTPADEGDDGDEDASDRPATKTDTIAIEGMEEEHEFTLHEVPELGFSTYVIDDMVAETISSSEDTAFRAYANFGDKRSTEAVIEILAPSGIDTVSDAVDYKEGLLAGTERTMVERETPGQVIDWASEEYAIEGQGVVEGQRITGTVSFGERQDRVYIVTSRYPVEYGDGFAPRSSKLFDDLEWMAD